MAVTIGHNTPADGTFSAAGSTAWNEAHTAVGTPTLLPFFDPTTGALTEYAGLSFNASHQLVVGDATFAGDYASLTAGSIQVSKTGGGFSQLGASGTGLPAIVYANGTYGTFCANGAFSAGVVAATGAYTIGEDPFNPGTNIRFQIDPGGDVTLSDLAGTGSRAVVADATGKLSASSAVGTPVVSVETYSATMGLDWTGKDEIQVELTGNLDLATMSGGVAGKRYMLTFKQDVSGTRVLTNTGTNLRFSDDLVSIVLSTLAGRIDRIGLVYHGADSKFDVVAINKGFH